MKVFKQYFRALEYKENIYQTQIEEFKSERVEVYIDERIFSLKCY